MPGVIRFQHDVGLLSNKRMAAEIAVGIAHLTGRRLSMPFEKPIGAAPVSSIPKERAGPAARVLDLLELPLPIVHPDEWEDEFEADAGETHDWGALAMGLLVTGPDIPVGDPVFTDFVNGREQIWTVPHSDARVLRINGRLLAFYSYFFFATGVERRGLHALLRGVRPRRPYRELGASIASDVGRFNVAHIRRSDLTKGIKAYGDVTPEMIAENLANLLPTDELLLVCSEVDAADELFDPLRARFSDIVFANDLILEDHEDGFFDLPHHEDNALGIVTQLVGARATAFVGTMGSTFSAMIQRERVLADPAERFLFTADFSPSGPTFERGEFQEVHDGSFSWNRIGLAMSPDVLAWFREMAGGCMIDDPHGPLYSVVCTDTNPYGDWQTRLLEHSWREVGMPGELVRLVAAPGDTPVPVHSVARVVKTEATNTHPRMPIPYAGMNRLLSLREWLERERPVGTVVILDCDFVFRAPVDIKARPGVPIAQEWWAFGIPDKLDAAWQDITDVDRSEVQPATWPLFIHTSDLRRIMPRWIDLTVQLRETTGAWESDMYACVIVLAEFGLRCDFETVGAWMNWPEDFVAGAPIIHYCQPVVDADGEQLWYKQEYRPWEPLGFDPQSASLDYTRDLMTILERFIATKQESSEG